MSQQFSNVAAQLAGATVGCRVRFSWLGAARSLDDSQSERAAEVFGANADALRVQKRIFDDRRPEYRLVNRKKNELRDYWKNHTLPFTEPGVRLLKRDNVETFSTGFSALCDELATAVDGLDSVYSELLEEARDRLGELYNPADYPPTLRGKFTAAFDFPNLSPPDYLAQLSPELFERERERVAAQFAESVELAERAFADELAGMLARIVETLNGSTDGKPKIFRDSMVENVSAFFERFRALNVTGSAELAELVERAQNAMAGVTPNALRASVHVRDMVKSAMADIQSELSSNIIDRPTRRVQFTPAPKVATPEPEQPAAELQPTAEPEPVADVITPEPVAVVSPDVAAAFGLSTSDHVRIVEPVAEPVANVAPVGWSHVETSTPELEQPADVITPEPVANVATVATPEPVNVGSTATPPEPRPAFSFNYGNGRRVVVAGR